jgi:hypothetical protein
LKQNKIPLNLFLLCFESQIYSIAKQAHHTEGYFILQLKLFCFKFDPYLKQFCLTKFFLLMNSAQIIASIGQTGNALTSVTSLNQRVGVINSVYAKIVNANSDKAAKEQLIAESKATLDSRKQNDIDTILEAKTAYDAAKQNLSDTKKTIKDSVKVISATIKASTKALSVASKTLNDNEVLMQKEFAALVKDVDITLGKTSQAYQILVPVEA